MSYEEQQHYVGEVGTLIQVNTGINLASATTLELMVEKPDGTTYTWVATPVNDSSGNLTVAQYTLQVGDFNQIGVYKIQVYIVSPTWTGLGNTASFVVYAPFN